MLESLDTEVTGVDLYHGATPYLVTFCDEEFNNTFYEWDVNPLTREVKVPKIDAEEIAHRILNADRLLLQNPKFDVAALLPILPEGFVWPWDITLDTLMAAHLLASNHAKDLTSLGIEYCAVDISGFEALVEEATKACRDIVTATGSRYSDWRIAKAGLPEMPSAKEKVWKFDMWLPRAMAKRKVPGWKPEWLTVTQDYANTDSATTIGVFKVQEELLRERGLWRIYEERLKLLPIIHGMERRGVVINKERLDKLSEQYTEESRAANNKCINIAKSYNHELTLPKSGNNKSLTTFVFEVLKLPITKVSKKSGNPSLDKTVLEEYEAILPSNSKPLRFVQNLRAKRKRDTALSYMEGYKKYWVPLIGGVWNGPMNSQGHLTDESTAVWYTIHPSLNPTGTATLRFSSSNPNEQNISKQGMYEGDSATLRYLFGPAPGREWYCMDAANIELRIPAYESNEVEMIELFEKPNEPPYYGSQHALNFSVVFPEIWEKIMKEVGPEKCGRTCKERYKSTNYQWVKNGGFAVQYGAVNRDDGEGTADRAFHKPGAHSLLKQKFSRLEKLNSYWIKFAEKHGYVETMVDKSLGVDRGYPLLCTRSERGYILPTVPLNYHVQGTAMWWMCKAMIRCQAYIDDYNAGKPEDKHINICLQVHDELDFDFPVNVDKSGKNLNIPIVYELAAEMVKSGDDIGVPVPVKAEHHPFNWSEGEYVYLD